MKTVLRFYEFPATFPLQTTAKARRIRRLLDSVRSATDSLPFPEAFFNGNFNPTSTWMRNKITKDPPAYWMSKPCKAMCRRGVATHSWDFPAPAKAVCKRRHPGAERSSCLFLWNFNDSLTGKGCIKGMPHRGPSKQHYSRRERRIEKGEMWRFKRNKKGRARGGRFDRNRNKERRDSRVEELKRLQDQGEERGEMIWIQFKSLIWFYF